MKERPDVVFTLVTKRPERIKECLPSDWGDGWENIWLNVTTENQMRADERIPILLSLPFKHKGILIAPFIGEISLAKYLSAGVIENVWCGGENYDGARPLYYSWVEKIANECKAADVTFSFFETGNVFIKNGRRVYFENKTEQMKYAFMQNLNYESTRPQVFNIEKSKCQQDLFGNTEAPSKFFQPHCNYCSQKKYCSGCSNCGKCKGKAPRN